jgi:hypothetical protein
MCHRTIRQLGHGAISRPDEDMYVSDSTHVVISKTCLGKRRPLKVIGALASGKFVITTDYLEACRSAGHFVDEWDFVPLDLQPIIKNVLRCGRVFENMTAVVFLKQNGRQAEFKTILRDGGANVLNWSIKDLVFKPMMDLLTVSSVDLGPRHIKRL